MQYTKPALTFEQQADLLISRGLIADRTKLISRLKSVNYYRLSGYLYPFRGQNDHYKSGTTLVEVWCRYTFDRRLRLMIMDPIERLEISLRTSIIYLHAHKHGPFGYTDRSTLPQLSPEDFQKFSERFSNEHRRSKEVFVAHFNKTYGSNHADLPVWMAGELMDFGALLTFYRGLSYQDRQSIASQFKINDSVLLSWLICFNSVRNICAHHSRLWNRELGNKPLIPDVKSQVWHQPFTIPNKRVFGVLTICNYLLKTIAPQSCWKTRFLKLMSDYPQIPVNDMGFVSGWESHPIWI